MTLREKIDGLHTAKTGWVKLADVLRIVAEHEQQTKGGDPIVPKPSQRSSDARESVTAPLVGQARGEPERWDKNLPSTQIPAYLCAACTLEVEVGETFGFCPKCSKPLEMNPRWVAETPEVEQMARQQEPAEVRLWRRELERLRASIGQEPDPLSMADHRRLAALLDLAILADVIASGRSQAVVPKGVAQYMPIEGGGHHPAGIWEPWSDRGDWALRDRRNGLYTADKEYILTAINAYGDSLCGAP